MPAKVIFIPGTYQSGMNIFASICKITSGKITPVPIKVPSSYGESMSYNESVNKAIRQTVDLIELFESDVYVVGFSQGAHAAGSAVVLSKNREAVKGVYLISDPMRSPADRLIGPDAPGSGIMGQRIVGDNAVHFSAPDDFVSANTNAFISNVGRYTYDMKIRQPTTWLKAIKKASKLHEPGGNAIKAIDQVRQAITSGSHIRYNTYEVEPGVTVPEWIGKDMLGKVPQ